MTSKPVLAASASENVLFPDPASPVTMTRRPTANGASLIAVSVPHVPNDVAQPAFRDAWDAWSDSRFWDVRREHRSGSVPSGHGLADERRRTAGLSRGCAHRRDLDRTGGRAPAHRADLVRLRARRQRLGHHGHRLVEEQAAAQGAALQPLRADRRGALLLLRERRRAGRVGRADGRRRRWPAHGPPLLRRRARRLVYREHQGRGVPHLDHASRTLVVGGLRQDRACRPPDYLTNTPITI